MSKRRWIAGVVGIWLAWHWLRADPEPAPKAPIVQLAVLKDGFAVAEAMDDRHLIELDNNGTRRKRWAIPLLGDLRIVGSRAGATLAWIDTKDKVLRLAPLKKDGELGKSSAFGRNAAQLCDGAASNARGFTVAWRASDKGLWFVRGPLTADVGAFEAAKVPDATIADVGPKVTCAVRAAGDSDALFWRVGRGMEFDFCTPQACQGLRAKVPFKEGEEIKDLACQPNGCAAVIKAGHSLRIVGFDLRGKVRWQRALQAEALNDVLLTAVGENAYAVSYATLETTAIDRVLASNGSTERIINLGTGVTPPVMTWARDYLAFAFIDGGTLQTAVRYLAP